MIHPTSTIGEMESVGQEISNSSLDYSLLCDRINSIISNPNSFEIIHDGFNGGLGHKFISIYHSLTYAIVTRRRFYRLSHLIHSYLVNIAPSIWNVTSSCFIHHRYVDQVTTHAIYPNHSRLTNKDCYEGLNRKRSNEIRERENTIEGILGDENVVLYDCRMNHSIIHSSFTLQTLNNHQILSFNQSITDYQQIIYRLLLNPSYHLQYQLNQFKKEHFIRNHVVGIQIRMGGCLANYQEYLEMMSFDELIRLPSFIQSTVKEFNFNPSDTVLFISTDSDYAEKWIRESLKNDYLIVTSTLFERSHTRGMAKNDASQGALFDMILLSDCDGLIICSGSGFGRVASSLSSSIHQRIYRVTHSPAIHFNLTTRSCNHF